MKLARVSTVLFALPALLVACSQLAPEPEGSPGSPSEAQLARGEALFARQCALCHGERGAGDGPAAFALFPPARDFTTGRFKLASAVNGAPTDADLCGTLTRGLPGSAMPSFGWMRAGELDDLVAYVRELSVQGLAERLRDEPDGAGLDGNARLRLARERLTPGEVRVFDPQAFVADVHTLALGRQLFLASCASCHGPDGQGLDVDRPDADLTLNRARDITAGVLKGGAAPADLARRIQAGMHGTAMPAAALEPEQVNALVVYTSSLIPHGSEDALVQHRETIPVRRVAGPVPLDPGDERWDDADGVDLNLAPLWWRDGAILHATVSGLHDGETLALLVQWDDDTLDALGAEGPPYATPPYADAVAVQLCDDPDPPFFGMGPGTTPTNLWHWKAVEAIDAELAREVLAAVPHALGRWVGADEPAPAEAPRYEAAYLALGDTVAAESAGMKRLAEQRELDFAVRSASRWEDGVWKVVFARELAPRYHREVALTPGGPVLASFALWNGAARDLRGQKSTTIWHALDVER